MTSLDNQLVVEEVAVVLEELLEKCCSGLIANTLIQNKSKSTEIIVINHMNSHEDTPCTSTKLSSQVTEDQDQIMELMPMQRSSLNRKDENDIFQLMDSMLDRCCEDSQIINIAEDQAKESNKQYVEISKMIGFQKEENSVSDAYNYNKDPDVNDYSPIDQNEEEILELRKVYLVQELVTQKENITNFQCESNQSLATWSPCYTINETIETPEKEVFREPQGFRNSMNGGDLINTHISNVEDIDIGQTLGKVHSGNEFSLPTNRADAEKNTIKNVLPLKTICIKALYKSSAEIFDHTQLSLKMLALKSFMKHKSDQNEQIEASDDLSKKISSISEHEQNLAMETSQSISEHEQNLAMETNLSIPEHDQNLAMETNLSIPEHAQDLVVETLELENSTNKESNTEETLHERQNHPFLLISTEQEKNICDNKITFVQSLGLSPLIHEERDLEVAVSSTACIAEKQQSQIPPINFQSDHKKPEYPTNKRNLSSCFENELFEKIEIDEESILIVEQTIPCECLRLENYKSGLYQLSENETQGEIQQIGAMYSATKIPSILFLNTSTGTDVKWEETVTMHCDEDGNKNNDKERLVEPQIILKEKLSNNSEGDSHDISEKKTKDTSDDDDVCEIANNSKRRDFVVQEVEQVQSSEQMVPSTVINEQMHTEDTESFYEEDSTKFQQCSPIKETILDDHGDTTDDSVHGVAVHVFESTCFKWKYTPSYDTDAVVPNSQRDDNEPSCKILPLSSCKKPIRLGLSKKQSRLVSLHPYIKKQ